MLHHTVICGDLLCLFDDDGDGIECHELVDRAAADQQLAEWAIDYDFDLAEARHQLDEFFAACH